MTTEQYHHALASCLSALRLAPQTSIRTREFHFLHPSLMLAGQEIQEQRNGPDALAQLLVHLQFAPKLWTVKFHKHTFGTRSPQIKSILSRHTIKSAQPLEYLDDSGVALIGNFPTLYRLRKL